MNSERFAEKRDTGVGWLAEIPRHWEPVPGNWLFCEGVERARTDDRHLSATQKYGVIPLAEFERLEGRRVTHALKNLDQRKHVEADDFVISMRSFQGGIERVMAKGCVRSSYVVLHASPAVHVGFFSYLFKSSAYIQGLQATAAFIRDGQDLNYGNFRKLKLPRLHIDEQRKIADHLDRSTSRIDNLIAKKTRFIELLREKREALITRAVTKGLDAGVSTKESGIQWLGRLPGHWSRGRLGKFALSRCDGPFGSSLKSSHYTSEGVRVVRLQNIGFASFLPRNPAYVGFDYWSDQLGCGHDVRPGDLLMAGLGDDRNPLGRSCVAPDNIGAAMVKADCYRFRLGSRLDGRYAAFALSATARAECGLLANGATRDRLNLSLAASRILPVPPLNEQRDIVSYLDRDTSRIDTLLGKTERSIELLREHRTALITAAVTGKIDCTVPPWEQHERAFL